MIVLAVVATGCLGLYMLEGAHLLIVDKPRPADVILVLGGDEEARSQRAIELLRQRYAPRALIDTVDWTAWGVHSTDLARSFIDSKSDVAKRIDFCTMEADSTRTEATAAAACLRRVNAHSVLLVTSDFHTRRALMIFRHQLPEYEFTVAAYRDSEEFGYHWWTHREWAANFWKENLKLIWFAVAYRWRE